MTASLRGSSSCVLSRVFFNTRCYVCSSHTMLSQTMCEKLEKEVDSRLTIRAERLWSFRFCDSVSFSFNSSPLFKKLMIVFPQSTKLYWIPSGLAAVAQKCRVSQQLWTHYCSCTWQGEKNSFVLSLLGSTIASSNSFSNSTLQVKIVACDARKLDDRR